MQILCFGEVMLRLVPAWRGERLSDSSLLRITCGGSEANVAVALAALGGHRVSFLSALPKNSLGIKAQRDLQARNVRCVNINTSSEKMGIYWVELGNGPKPSDVIYDRYNSAFDQIKINAIRKKDLFCDWFHTSGITLGISKRTNQALFRCLELLPEDAKASFDLNYRKKLWQWATVGQMQGYYKRAASRSILLGGNESDYQDCLGIQGKGRNVSGIYSHIAQQLFMRYKRLKFIAVSLRESHSATLNTWSGLLFVKTERSFDAYAGMKVKIDSIVDRLGTGDSFLAGIIFGLNSFKKDYQKILDFAIMLSALNHTTFGDFSNFSKEEVFDALRSSGNGRIRR